MFNRQRVLKKIVFDLRDGKYDLVVMVCLSYVVIRVHYCFLCCTDTGWVFKRGWDSGVETSLNTQKKIF